MKLLTSHLLLSSLFIEKLPKHPEYKNSTFPEKKDTLKVSICNSFIKPLPSLFTLFLI